MRALVLGLGSAGRRHVINLAQIDPELCLVVLERSVRPDAIPPGVDFATAADLEEALSADLDMAIVSSASADHIKALPSLLRAQVPIFVEKPIVTSRGQLDEIIEVLEESGYDRPSMVGCNLRFLPSLAVIRDACAMGKLGPVRRAHFEAGQWLPDWRPAHDYRTSYSADPDRGGGVLLDLIHEIDAVRWLLGEFDKVTAMAGSWSSLEVRSEDAAAVLLSRSGGPVVSVGLDYVARVPVRRYVLIGEEATAVWDLGSRTATVEVPGSSPVQLASDRDFDIPATYAAAMEEFVSAVRLGAQTSQPLREGIRSLDLALRAKEAAAI